MLNIDTDQVALTATNWTVVNDSKLGVTEVDDRTELLHAIDTLIAAVAKNQSTQNSATSLVNKGWWDSFKDAVSGANDKSLATMVKDLGGSLETTQQVVQIMLRLQTKKDSVLRNFHSTLVEKIIRIQADTQTLDSSQRNVALHIVSALRDQVEDQIRQGETVDRHDQKLREIDNFLVKTASTEADYQNRFNELTLTTNTLTSQVSLLNGAITTLEAKLIHVESALAHGSSWSARLRHQFFGIVGLLIGIASLMISLRG